MTSPVFFFFIRENRRDPLDTVPAALDMKWREGPRSRAASTHTKDAGQLLLMREREDFSPSHGHFPLKEEEDG